MWSSSGSPATLPRHTAGSSAPVDWDSLLPLLPESVRLLRQVLEDDAALHRLLEHCGGLTLRIPRRFPSEGHLLRALHHDEAAPLVAKIREGEHPHPVVVVVFHHITAPRR